ncbi:ATP-binding cassette domain-containing protein [Nocardioides albus]|uniref:Energy-coupling factor transporter ATP-binding protein EcfA2 n=1 Tax=Nocardioides albus TaxID=1841 RepID=A0A7W5A365_9ACTN|nr:ATP-binding cassette domain-containing protein [Nocardioides albus]MBB3088654.1 energy-coupling factor transporter ATP-binding protein EcfA2 [Nocardioides albus]GGU17679.1 ABC transporter ATP-binding protein [Nocardioides albus]
MSEDAVDEETTTLRATGVRVRQGVRDLLPTTSVTLREGEVAVAVGPPGGGHTSLALALAGRLRLDAGRVTLDGDATPGVLQAAVALVDVPGVSEPDEVVPFRTILGEELAMARHKPSAAIIDHWLRKYDLPTDITTEAVPPGPRLEILGRMASMRPGTRFLVLTYPERLGLPAEDWLAVANDLAGAAPKPGVLVTASAAVVIPAGVRTSTIGPTEEA